MTPSDSTPKLPLWVFLVTAAVRIGTAVLIAQKAEAPLTPAAMGWIAGCVVAGALVVFIPMVARYERVKNEQLDERQREIEALARTLASSAEQISIAASGLHEIADIAQKNLKHADQLPHKLQEKIAEFQAQLGAAQDAEKEELEKELVALRTTESERLEAISTKMAKAAAEFGKLEAATQKNLAACADLVTRTTDALGHAQTQAARALDEKLTGALSQLDAKLAELNGKFAGIEGKLSGFDTTLAAGNEKLERTLAAGAAAAATAVAAEAAKVVVTVAAAAPTSAPASASPSAPAEESTAQDSAEMPTSEGPAHPPKRPHKPRREESEAEAEAEAAEAVTPAVEAAATATAEAVPTETAAPEEPPVAVLPTPPVESAVIAPPASEPGAVESAPAAPAETPEATAEPQPLPAEKIAEVAPVTAPMTEPLAETISPSDETGAEPAAPTVDEAAAVPPSPPPAPPVASATSEPSAASVTEATPPVVSTPAAETAATADASTPFPVKEAPKPARKRPAKKADEDDGFALDLGLDDTRASGGEPAEKTLSSDGATRLIVTAYIGIGNRLFIRGAGPGLSWEKGVPLQFVSIGKWRWETNDASEAVQFKLYKNDEIECAALGAQSVEPGYQAELSAAF